MKKLFTVIIILFFSSQLPGVVWVNDTDCIFYDHPDKPVITENIVSGAMHFIKSKSYADLLLYEYEKSANLSFNFSASLGYIEKSVLELESAKKKYIEALKIGKVIGYNERKVPWFKNFDYAGFIQFSNLDSGVASRVKTYLSSGDVLGIYQHTINNIEDILNTLYLVRERVRTGKKPELTDMWKLLQQYATATLFGNYATMMGSTILGNCEEGESLSNQ
jgi:hypothetical protein